MAAELFRSRGQSAKRVMATRVQPEHKSLLELLCQEAGVEYLINDEGVSFMVGGLESPAWRGEWLLLHFLRDIKYLTVMTDDEFRSEYVRVDSESEAEGVVR